MGMEWYDYYRVEGEEQLRIAAEFMAERWAAIDAGNEFAKSHGGTALVRRGDWPHGILVAAGNEVGREWKKDSEQNIAEGVIFVPDRRSKTGRVVDKQLKGFRRQSGTSLASKWGVHEMRFRPSGGSGSWMCQSEAFQIGDDWYCRLPKADGVPAKEVTGFRLLKLSEYVAAKEADDAAKTVAA